MCLFGGLTGVLAGAFTVWSRQRLDGRESIVWVLATYYLAIVSYWLGLVAARSIYIVKDREAFPSGFLDRALNDLVWIAAYGTFYGVVLIPLCWLTRHLVWRAHVRQQDNPEPTP